MADYKEVLRQVNLIYGVKQKPVLIVMPKGKQNHMCACPLFEALSSVLSVERVLNRHLVFSNKDDAKLFATEMGTWSGTTKHVDDELGEIFHAALTDDMVEFVELFDQGNFSELIKD